MEHLSVRKFDDVTFKSMNEWKQLLILLAISQTILTFKCSHIISRKVDTKTQIYLPFIFHATIVWYFFVSLIGVCANRWWNFFFSLKRKKYNFYIRHKKKTKWKMMWIFFYYWCKSHFISSIITSKVFSYYLVCFYIEFNYEYKYNSDNITRIVSLCRQEVFVF